MMFVEENAEFTLELTKGLRDNKNYSRTDAIDEFADVSIMLEQMQLVIGASDEEVEEAKERKLDKLIEYLEDYRKKKRKGLL